MVMKVLELRRRPHLSYYSGGREQEYSDLEVLFDTFIRAPDSFRQRSVRLFEIEAPGSKRGTRQKPPDSEKGFKNGNKELCLISLSATAPGTIVGLKEEDFVNEDVAGCGIELSSAEKKTYYCSNKL